MILLLSADLVVQRHQIDGVAGEMPGVHGPAGAARDQRGLALTLAQEVLGRDLARALDHPNQVGVHVLQRITDSLLRQKALRRYPMRQVTTPVAVEGGVAGGALPMSAGTSFQGRRKPKGSACHRRTMWPVQQAPQHRIRAMSPLKSWLVEKPQPQR